MVAAGGRGSEIPFHETPLQRPPSGTLAKAGRQDRARSHRHRPRPDEHGEPWPLGRSPWARLPSAPLRLRPRTFTASSSTSSRSAGNRSGWAPSPFEKRKGEELFRRESLSRSWNLPYRSSGKKLVPIFALSPKNSATVAPRSANELRVPRSPPRPCFVWARSGTYSRE